MDSFWVHNDDRNYLLFRARWEHWYDFEYITLIGYCLIWFQNAISLDKKVCNIELQPIWHNYPRINTFQYHIKRYPINNPLSLALSQTLPLPCTSSFPSTARGGGAASPSSPRAPPFQSIPFTTLFYHPLILLLGLYRFGLTASDDRWNGGGSDLVVSAWYLLLRALSSGLTAKGKPRGRQWFGRRCCILLCCA